MIKDQQVPLQSKDGPYQHQKSPMALAKISELENSFIYKIFFWTAGVSCLVVWSSIMSINSYWSARFSQNVATYFPFVYMAGALISFLSFIKLNNLISLNKRIFVPPIYLCISFIVVAIIGELMDKSVVKETIFYVIIFLNGFVSELFQFSISSYVFCFGYYEIAAFTNGTSLAALICSTLSFIIFLTVDANDYFLQITLNVVMISIVLALALLVFYLYFKDFVQKYQKDGYENLTNNDEDLALVEEIEQAAFEEIKNHYNKLIENSKIESLPDIMEVFCQIWKFCLFLFMTFAITFSVYPAYIFKLNFFDIESGVKYPLIVFMFGLLDFIGKFGNSLYGLQYNHWFHVLGFGRYFIPVALILSYSIGDGFLKNAVWFSFVFLVVVALSNGVYVSACFSLSSESVQNSHKAVCGYLMMMFMLSGIVLGSIVPMIFLS